MEKISSLSDLILSWFKENRRDLPWRKTPKDPYRVWVSEVMLQQTRVEVVIPYFERFMRQFPTLTALAEAEDHALLKAWEGLGYYSRVRALKKTALLLVASKQVTLPSEKEQLLQLPGIGPYTAGAIMAFAFQKKGIAIDGNVKRVMSRLFAIGFPIDSKELWNEVETRLENELLIGDEPSLIMEGLIELGALVCTPTPKCTLCPMESCCAALKQNRQLELPIPKKRAVTSQMTTEIALVHYQDEGIDFFLIKPPKDTGLFKGLALFPTDREVMGEREYDRVEEQRRGFTFLARLEDEVQTYTRYRETLRPAIYRASCLERREGLLWITREQLETLSMPAGHRKLKNRIFAFLKRI